MVQTQTQEWIAAGHRHDDPALWEALCAWLEQNGPVTESGLPANGYFLVVRAKENTYYSWLQERFLLPIWYRQNAARRGGNGWKAKKDWRERVAVMRDPTTLLAYWRRLLARWRVENERLYVVDANGMIHERDGTPATATHASCAICSGSRVVELSDADRAAGLVPLALHAGDCQIQRLWFLLDHQQRVMARDALAAETRRTRHNGRMRDHIASAERLAATTRYLIHELRDDDAVTWAVEVGDDDAITITPTEEIPDPDCQVCTLLQRPPADETPAT